MKELEEINDTLRLLAEGTERLQRKRALELNLTFYRLTESGEIVPVSAREYFNVGHE